MAAGHVTEEDGRAEQRLVETNWITGKWLADYNAWIKLGDSLTCFFVF